MGHRSSLLYWIRIAHYDVCINSKQLIELGSPLGRSPRLDQPGKTALPGAELTQTEIITNKLNVF